MKRWKKPNNIRWELIEYEYSFCPVCGANIYMDFNTTADAQAKWDKEHLYHYCPMCGTNMFLDEPSKHETALNAIRTIVADLRERNPNIASLEIINHWANYALGETDESPNRDSKTAEP